jgi:hypothetical protein
MVSAGVKAYIQNSKGQQASSGDKIKLKLYMTGMINPNKSYKILEIKQSGLLVLEDGICLPIQGIIDFTMG